MNRRKHTSEFKMDAVRLAQRDEVVVSQAARDLDIHESLLQKWMKQFGRKADGNQVTASEHEELVRLRRENRILKEKREILRKAAAYFAKEQF